MNGLDYNVVHPQYMKMKHEICCTVPEALYDDYLPLIVISAVGIALSLGLYTVLIAHKLQASRIKKAIVTAIALGW